MKRKYPSLSPTKLYATMKPSKWKLLLNDCMKRGNTKKLIAWRYGLQAGLADENSGGKHTTDSMDLWVIGRLKDIENAMKHILRAKYPNPFDNPLAKVGDDVFAKAQAAKKKRDAEFSEFLMRSNF